MKKKLYAIAFSVFLALGCFVSSATPIHAEGEDTTAPILKSISQTVTETKLRVDFHVEDDLSQLNEVQMSWTDENGNPFGIFSTPNSVNAKLIEDELGQYYFELDFKSVNLKNGTYKATVVSLRDAAQNNRTYLRGCPIDVCSDQLPGGEKAWEGLNFTVSGIDELKAPELLKLEPKQSLKNINVKGNGYKTDLDLQIKDLKKDETLMGNLYYYNESTNTVVQNHFTNIDSIGGKFTLSIHEEARYNGQSYKLLYASFNISKDYVMGDASNYSFMDEAELKSYIEYVPSNLKSLNGITTPGALDISIADYVIDHEVPVLESVAWEKNTLSLPGIARLNVKATDSGSGLSYVPEAVVKMNEEVVQSSGSQGKDDKYTTNYALGRYHAEGSLQVEMVSLVDKAGNVVYYCRDDVKSKYVDMYGADKVRALPIVNDVTVTKGQKYDVMLSADDPAFLNKLKQVEEGKTVVVDTSLRKVIKKDIFEWIKGKNITLIFDDVFGSEYESQGVQWIFNGKDMNGPLKDIDLKTTIQVRNLHITDEAGGFGFGIDDSLPLQKRNEVFLGQVKNQKILSWYYQYLLKFDITKVDLIEAFQKEMQKHEYTKIVFQPNGVLPGKATIRLRLSYALRNYMPSNKINAYYVNDKKYELVDSDITIEDDDSYEFNITHNSDYVLTGTNIETILGIEDNETTDEKPSNTPSPDTGDQTNVLGYIFMLGISVVGIYCLKAYKKLS